MTNSTPTDYIMDDPREADRLASKVDAPAWVERYALPHAADASVILDVGCGPGHLTGALARRLLQARVVGLDLSADRIAEARRRNAELPNAEFLCGSALEIPMPDASVDFAFCRFLLQYLPDPARAVQEMKRVLRPGGRLLLQDLDGQFVWHYPIDEELQRGIEAVLAALSKTGFDPFVGRKLYHFAYTAGLRDIAVQIEPYHLIAGRATEEQLAQWRTKLARLPLLEVEIDYFRAGGREQVVDGAQASVAQSGVVATCPLGRRARRW